MPRQKVSGQFQTLYNFGIRRLTGHTGDKCRQDQQLVFPGPRLTRTNCPAGAWRDIGQICGIAADGAGAALRLMSLAEIETAPLPAPIKVLLRSL